MELIDFKKAKAGRDVVKSRRDAEIIKQRLRESEYAFNEDLSSIFYDVCLAQADIHAWAKDLPCSA